MSSVNNGGRSIYETIKQHDQDSEASDGEERAGLATDEENLGQSFHDVDVEGAPVEASQATSPISGSSRRMQSPAAGKQKTHRRLPRWMQDTRRLLDVDEGDDEVPQSLLIEDSTGMPETREAQSRPPADISTPVPGPVTPRAKMQWKTTQAQQMPHSAQVARGNQPPPPIGGLTGLQIIDPKAKALWRWANVQDLDNFLKDVYIYFLGHGFWAITMRRALNLLRLAFVVGFGVFLTSCVNYSKLRGSTNMSQIVVDRCIAKVHGLIHFVLWIFCFFWIIKLFQYAYDVRRLLGLRNFYTYLLEITELELQTISWPDIVERLMLLRDSNPHTTSQGSAKSRKFLGAQSKQRMDAHDIANRLMRKENYFIALINKEVLDFTLPIPFLNNRPFYSRTLEWNINQCVFDFTFSEKGQIQTLFLKDTHRKQLSEALIRRFKFAAVCNLLIAPFLIVYFLLHYFFEYFNEYQRNPSQIGMRQFNPLAEWKFREFNELWHLFQRRLNMSYPFAAQYVDQFPKDKTVQLARFVAFIAGALASVLAIASVVDPELFLGFEITKDRTVLFYLGILGSIFAVARGLLPEENVVFDSEMAMKEVILFTHYNPAHWQNRLHSEDVRVEFASLYQMKLVIFLEEILSMVFASWVLWYSLPKCSERIVDFFREFTVHVDGVGYVCSFAEFDFKRLGKAPRILNQNEVHLHRDETDIRGAYYADKDQKLAASYWGFVRDYTRNPGADKRFSTSMPRNRFHPAPTLAGPLSPSMMQGGGSMVHGSKYAFRAPDQMRGGPLSPSQAYAAGNSLVVSTLLDPHHQPAGLPNNPHQRGAPPKKVSTSAMSPHSTIRQRRATVDLPGLESPPLVQPGSKTLTGDAENRDSAQLGSWKLDNEDDNYDVEEMMDPSNPKTPVGIAGLIKQLQKVQGGGGPNVAVGV